MKQVKRDRHKIANLKYKRTIKGLITDIYSTQRSNCKRRGYLNPEYTKSELSDWILSQPNFQKLYDDWVESRYLKNLKPSVDRPDDYKGYSLNNIQLMTWKENHKKGNEDRKSGINNKMSKPVNQYNLKGTLINTFYSISEASRKLKITHSNIVECCQGKRKTVKKFIFKYE